MTTSTQETTERSEFYRFSDEAISAIRGLIQQALIDEDKSSITKLTNLGFTALGEELYPVADMITVAGKCLSPTTIAQLGNLVELSAASHTPFADHVRIMRLEVKDGRFAITPEYVDYYNACVQALAAQFMSALQSS